MAQHNCLQQNFLANYQLEKVMGFASTVNRLALKLVPFLTALAATTPSWADTIENVNVSKVGIQGQQLYVVIDRDFTGACSGRLAYLLFDNGNVDQVMSLLITAKISGTSITRLDYHLDDTCRIDLVQL